MCGVPHYSHSVLKLIIVLSFFSLTIYSDPCLNQLGNNNKSPVFGLNLIDWSVYLELPVTFEGSEKLKILSGLGFSNTKGLLNSPALI